MAPYLSEPTVAAQDTACTSGVKASFPYIDADAASLPASVDPFTITTSTGFMPFHAPIKHLPAVFEPLMRLSEEMPVTKLDGSPGLLASYSLGPTVDEDRALPNLTAEIDNLVAQDGQADLALVTAVFRDYSFLASAYLLEPCWERWSKGLDGYGLGRSKLPACLAGPLVKTAKLLDIPPFMAYAAAYSSYNYQFADPAIGTAQYDNLRLIRAFEYGLDPKSSEAGFILTHVDMIKHSGGLIQGAVSLLDAASVNASPDAAKAAFGTLLDSMRVIEQSMETMWANSKPKDYISYRTFIFGITNQSMFPNGVVYEGQSELPMHFRGESGANDSMIPLLDSLLEIPMPSNPLTEILKDFRSYRPKPHRDFLAYVRTQAAELGVREYSCKNVDTAVLYLRLLDHVRSFRWRHWLFAREYIIRRSSHPTATGGSPIVTWLPNQLIAVMDLMHTTWESIPAVQREEQAPFVREMMLGAQDQRQKLQIEVEKWCQERGV